MRVDVSDPDSAKEMAAQTLSEFGGIDYLVNNAAIFGGMKLDFLITVDWDYYKKFMSVNLDGALVCTRAVYRKMAKRGGGAIVNQSSTAAWLYSNFYGLAKVGINGLTQQLATELGGQNIRVNAIAPGPIDTEANRTTTPQEMVADIVKGIPLSRMGEPEDLVGMCLFLLSDRRRGSPARSSTSTADRSSGHEGRYVKARLHRPGQHGRADGQAAGRLAGRADRLRRPRRGDDPAGRGGREPGRQRGRRGRRRHHQRHRAQRRAGARGRRRRSPRTPSRAPSSRSTPRSATPPRPNWPTTSSRRAFTSSMRRSAAAPVPPRRASWRPWSGPRDEVFERIKPAFKQWASMVVHAGEPGAGTRMKLARNMLTFTSLSPRRARR